MSRFKAVVFDAYGTLFDVYSVGALAEALYPGHGAAISSLWRDKQIEYTRLISLSDPDPAQGSRYYLTFNEITRHALVYTLQRLDLESSEQKVSSLMDQYAQLEAFHENKHVLEQLRAKGVATSILSNGNPEMLASAVESAGMAHLLDHVISVDSIRQFKTSPACYQLVSRYFPVPKPEILFVSSNAWDALGATWYGFTALWINRQGLPYETIGPRPAFTGRDLNTVLEILGG